MLIVSLSVVVTMFITTAPTVFTILTALPALTPSIVTKPVDGFGYMRMSLLENRSTPTLVTVMLYTDEYLPSEEVTFNWSFSAMLPDALTFPSLSRTVKVAPNDPYTFALKSATEIWLVIPSEV